MSQKILFIIPHRLGRSPGQRFRCEQYISYLEENGFKITYSNLLSETDDLYFYKDGYVLIKFYILVKSIFLRLFDILRSYNYDFIFIYREAIMIGTTFFERMLKLSGAKVIYDFDDSIWLNDTSDGNKKLSWLKNPEKTREICKLSNTVIVGNKYLFDYAKQFNNNVFIFPTTIDTSYHNTQFKEKINNYNVCVGWTGTSTTLKHFEKIVPVLKRLKSKYNSRINFKLIINSPYENESLNLKWTPWNLSTEIQDLSVIDIGIMPLPDDAWSRGKCGFKGLQYMSLGIPTVMSPVGVNKEIIIHQENGFLASSDEEWFSILSELIESKTLRDSVGAKGKQTIVEKYSVSANKDEYLSFFIL